jgi:hypothetical protein
MAFAFSSFELADGAVRNRDHKVIRAMRGYGPRDCSPPCDSLSFLSTDPVRSSSGIDIRRSRPPARRGPMQDVRCFLGGCPGSASSHLHHVRHSGQPIHHVFILGCPSDRLRVFTPWGTLGDRFIVCSSSGTRQAISSCVHPGGARQAISSCVHLGMSGQSIHRTFILRP